MWWQSRQRQQADKLNRSKIFLPDMIAAICANIGLPGTGSGWLNDLVMDNVGQHYLSSILYDRITGSFPEVETIAVTHENSLPLLGIVGHSFDPAEKRILTGQIRLTANDPDQAVVGSKYLAGKNTVLLQCVTVSGQSAIKAADILQKRRGKVLGLISIVDMEGDATANLAQAGIPFRPLYTINDIAWRRDLRKQAGYPVA